MKYVHYYKILNSDISLKRKSYDFEKTITCRMNHLLVGASACVRALTSIPGTVQSIEDSKLLQYSFSVLKKFADYWER